MEKLKLTITNIEKYIPNDTIIFEVDGTTGIMESDFRVIYEAFDYLNWYHNKQEYKMMFSCIENADVYNSIKDLLNKENQINVIEKSIAAVVGTIEFTEKYLGKEIKALNIPYSLRGKQFTGRYVDIIDSDKLSELVKSKYGELFIKDAHRTKKFSPFIYTHDTTYSGYIPAELMVSERVEFVAEFRAFIHRGKILDCKQYFGSYKVKYDVDKLEDMVEQWIEKPTACTLDIGVLTTGETVIIETHNFLCCGLYGFSGDKLANMTINAFKEEKRKNKSR